MGDTEAYPTWHLYLIECTDGSLYAGIATDVERRFQHHLAGQGARYTRSHKPLRLVASVPVGSRSDALRAELALKRLPKAQKILAIHTFSRSVNPTHSRKSVMNKSELIEAIVKPPSP